MPPASDPMLQGFTAPPSSVLSLSQELPSQKRPEFSVGMPAF